jgi:mannose-6-phosphate isomerase-like protein (cupin superfamily)
MGTLAFFHDADGGWLTGRDAESEGMQHIPDHREVDGKRRIRHPGSDDDLQLFECEVGPNEEIEAHAHTADEIIYVLEGTMHVGSQTLTAGSSVYIPGRTLYSFRTGADGLRFLNFRPYRDETHYSKEQFLAMRGASKAGGA